MNIQQGETFIPFQIAVVENGRPPHQGYQLRHLAEENEFANIRKNQSKLDRTTKKKKEMVNTRLRETYYLFTKIDSHVFSWNALCKYGHNNLSSTIIVIISTIQGQLLNDLF